MSHEENKSQTKLKDKGQIWKNMYNIYGWKRLYVIHIDRVLFKMFNVTKFKS